MTLLHLYPHIKHLHYSAALASGMFFLLRALGLLAGMRWPRARAVRYLSYTVDTVLLACALALIYLLPYGVFANGWLWTKLALVLAYIALGIAAFRSPQFRYRAALVLLALLCFGQIYGIARHHHPLGWFLLS